MLGTGVQCTRGRGAGEDRFYDPRKARRAHRDNDSSQQQLLRRAHSDVTPSGARKPQQQLPVEEEAAAADRFSNLDRFIGSITPSVPAQYLPKTTARGLRTHDADFQPYFVLGDLWESFKEWSAYGAGVPLILNESDCVVQYYVPYLSGIQIYGESLKPCNKQRRPGEDSDSDFRDSSSDGSSDCEQEGGPKRSGQLWNHHHIANELQLRVGRLSLREPISNHEEFSSDEGESINSKGRLLFEYLEYDPPYSREPLADKIMDLASRIPALKTLRSCDLLPSSWISVAWYPIYRIPTGPTLKDLDACFLTYHSLHTPLGGARSATAPALSRQSEMDGVPKMSLPVFGLASYKFKSSLWTSTGGCDHKLADSLLLAADNWLRLLQANHPDYMFFSR